VTRPPRVAGLLLRVLLPPDPFEAIAGDLDEAWSDGSLSRAAYWRLAAASVSAYYREQVRPAPLVFVFDGPPARGDGLMRSLIQDLGYGVRVLRRAPGFTAAAIATLALGIGANTAIFSMVNIQMLKPLSYRQPERVAFVLGWNAERQERRFSLSYADFVELKQRARSLEDVAAYSYWSANLTGGDLPERIQAYRVTVNTFAMLGVAPALGRGPLPEEGRAGGREVVVIGHGLWQRRFGGDPSAVGRVVQLDGRPHTIVGVMPRSFEYPIFNFKGDVWTPLRMEQASMLADRGSANATIVARLGDGIPYAKAQADVDTVMRQLAAEHPDTNRSRGARLVEMGAMDDEMAGPAMLIVVVTVAVVLLLACANVANLLLARGVSRQRELAVRAALGASRSRIARQLLAESLLLGLGGGAAGAGVAFVALSALRGALPEILIATQPNIDQLGVDGFALGFTLALSIATGVIFGLVPALKTSRPRHEDLKESAGAGGSAHTRRLRATLVIAEVALSTVLLVGAGLLVRSYQNLQRLTPGFEAGGVLTMALTLPDYRYQSAESRRQFFSHAVERIERLPGVRSASFVNTLPFSTYNRGGSFLIDGQPAPQAGREPAADHRVITTAYFRTLAIPVVAGRPFDESDRAGGAPVAIVNRALVRTFFAGRDPIGSRLRIGTSPDQPWLTIVGVVGDVHHAQLSTAPAPEIYRPYTQAPAAMMMLAARVDGDPAALAAAARAEIQAIDPAQPVYHVKTLARLVSDSMMPQTSAATLVTLFTAVALLLAAVGIYGVLSYAVSQQTREFGVRMALGAQPGDVVRLVARRGLTLVIGGIAIGVAAALAVTRLMADALYGVGSSDPATYASAIAILMLVGCAACGVPAWRATRVQPVVALRNE
jgi:putative ABC transport system permease protein